MTLGHRQSSLLCVAAAVLLFLPGCSAREQPSRKANPKATASPSRQHSSESRKAANPAKNPPGNHVPASPGQRRQHGATATPTSSPSPDYSAIAKRFAAQTIRHGARNPERKAVCLTFDDGPLPPCTAQILDILKKENVKATFFMLGYNAQRFPDLARRVADEGHAIGNHTYDHRKRTYEELASWEVHRGAEAIEQATGVKPFLFRPPGGDLKSRETHYAKKSGYALILWSISSADTTTAPPETLANNVIHTPGPGDIILMHDGGRARPNTVAALPKIIQELKKQGRVFLTVPALLEELAKWEDAQRHANPS